MRDVFTYHKWKSEDECGIFECERCGILMKRRALVHAGSMRSSNDHKWMQLYSKKGLKWSEQDHGDCINKLIIK